METATHLATATHRFSDLDAVIDEVHTLFQQWKETRTFCPPLGPDELDCAKLAVHEWLANLVQHADFEGRTPDIRVTMKAEPEGLQCIILDNSRGFDLDAQPQIDEQVLLETFPDRGMGLLLLKASTTGLSYQKTANGKYRLQFFVSP